MHIQENTCTYNEATPRRCGKDGYQRFFTLGTYLVGVLAFGIHLVALDEQAPQLCEFGEMRSQRLGACSPQSVAPEIDVLQ